MDHYSVLENMHTTHDTTVGRKIHPSTHWFSILFACSTQERYRKIAGTSTCPRTTTADCANRSRLCPPSWRFRDYCAWVKNYALAADVPKLISMNAWGLSRTESWSRLYWMHCNVNTQQSYIIIFSYYHYAQSRILQNPRRKFWLTYVHWSEDRNGLSTSLRLKFSNTKLFYELKCTLVVWCEKRAIAESTSKLRTHILLSQFLGISQGNVSSIEYIPALFMSTIKFSRFSFKRLTCPVRFYVFSLFPNKRGSDEFRNTQSASVPVLELYLWIFEFVLEPSSLRPIWMRSFSKGPFPISLMLPFHNLIWRSLRDHYWFTY